MFLGEGTSFLFVEHPGIGADILNPCPDLCVQCLDFTRDHSGNDGVGLCDILSVELAI